MTCLRPIWNDSVWWSASSQKLLRGDNAGSPRLVRPASRASESVGLRIETVEWWSAGVLECFVQLPFAVPPAISCWRVDSRCCGPQARDPERGSVSRSNGAQQYAPIRAPCALASLRLRVEFELRNDQRRCRRAGFPACRFTGLSSPVVPIRCPKQIFTLELATGKSPEPAGWKACPTSVGSVTELKPPNFRQ